MKLIRATRSIVLPYWLTNPVDYFRRVRPTRKWIAKAIRAVAESRIEPTLALRIHHDGNLELINIEEVKPLYPVFTEESLFKPIKRS